MSKREQGLFPRYGMAYTDRFRMTVKDFGREILIELNRGTANVSDDGKKIIINYADSPTRRIAKVKEDFYAQRVVATAKPPRIPRPGSFFDMVRAQAVKPTTLAKIIAYCAANGKFTTAKSTTFVATVRVRHALTRYGFLQLVE